ncbi:hypothetical protein H9X96_12795 [Pedobacter sp. N36a]|uniref:hypothetical protein n=1 Tax=Pedobacter sp. N36a TaxID=2767996 RepID=UPI001656D3E6|nr:hypothetical protein [Pedobacter sp. N36a]MBC8986654.1 hypothetical protein [Pedobacter sp. N36a]
MDWSLIISIAALCFSAITYVVHDRRIKKQEGLINAYQLEKIDAEKIEQKKAFVKANLIKGHKGNKIIKIFNSGKSAARNIRFEILSEDQNFWFLNQDIFPFELLNPQESTELIISTSIGSPDKVKIQFIWEDDSSLSNKYEQVLTM